MRVLITGATGTIGLALADALRERGDQVVALSRDPERGQRVLGQGAEVHAWARPTEEPPPPEALRGADAVVHLLGEPVAQRWTERGQDARSATPACWPRGRWSRRSRRCPTASARAALVSQSATGYYGPRGDAPLDEHASPGDDFLAGVVVAWEREAAAAASAMRVVCTRTGVVLSPSGGALAKMLPFFRLGIGGPVAGGRQYVPWIHLDDVVGALLCCVDSDGAEGPVNVTAPNAGHQRRALARARARAGAPGGAAGARDGGQAAVRRDGGDRDHRPARGPGPPAASSATSSATRSWRRRCATS